MLWSFQQRRKKENKRKGNTWHRYTERGGVTLRDEREKLEEVDGLRSGHEGPVWEGVESIWFRSR